MCLLAGCSPIQPHYLHEDGDLSHYLDVATDIEYADVETPSLPSIKGNRAPLTIENPQMQAWDLTLEEAVSIAMHNSKVIKDNGQFRQFGQVIGNSPSRLQTNPDSVATVYDVAIQESGQSGVEQILSNFDAVFNSTVTWDSNNRPQNFANATANAAVIQQDQVSINNELSKLSISGAQWFFRHTGNYDGANNLLTAQTRAPGVPSSWTTALETEVRQPLLRGRGVQINRIPVVLARMRTDLALVDFEESVENLLNSMERAYWELYFQYRTLDAAHQGFNSALAAWQKVNALSKEQRGSSDREAQAREQYFAFSARKKQALHDLQRTETKLRYFMGLEPSDGRLIRPSDEPTMAKVGFDWCEVVAEALTFSNDLRRQQWQIKSREYELIAAKNQLLPQIDAVGLYRWVGVGDEYNKSGHTTQNFPAVGSTAIDSLLEGDFQEFRLGLSSQIPIGFREAMARVRSQNLALARAHAKYEETELELMHGLDDAYKNLTVTHELLQVNLNRRVAAAVQVEAAEVGLEQGGVELFTLLQAQRTRADADVSYFQTLVEYNEAIVEMHRIKGSLLPYNNVMLAEGPWPEKAYFDAHNLARQRDASYYLDYGFTRPRVASRGPVNQNRMVTVEPNEGGFENFEVPAEVSTDDVQPQVMEPEASTESSEPQPSAAEELPSPDASDTSDGSDQSGRSGGLDALESPEMYLENLLEAGPTAIDTTVSALSTNSAEEPLPEPPQQSVMIPNLPVVRTASPATIRFRE